MRAQGAAHLHSCMHVVVSRQEASNPPTEHSQVESLSTLTVQEWGREYNQECKGLNAAYRMVGLADAIASTRTGGKSYDPQQGEGDGSCSKGCPDPFEPLCRNGTCMAVSCERDAREHCSYDTVAGLRSRMICPET